MKRHDEDLDTTLIFVSFVWCLGMPVLTWSQAGLFSAVTSAFIIDVQSQLRPDPNDETAALLRVLIHKIDNTTFGDNPPTIPQWTGPPHSIIQVQAILYASLATSLLSAFLAMLGKQWLNQYASTDMRGTAIDRSQYRQHKLDGVVNWYFDYVMESLPLMLQAALLLLGCALTLYLWEIDVTLAYVILSITSSSVAFYIFVTSAGTASESCPYQTPGSHALRFLWPQVQRVLHSAFGDIEWKSKIVWTIRAYAQYHHPWWSRAKIMPFLGDMVLGIPRALVIDVHHLLKVMVQLLVAFAVGAYHLGSKTVQLFIHQPHGSSSSLEQGVDQQPTALDLRCISWMLRISLDKAVHLSTLKHLTTMMPLTNFDPTLIMDCFNAFVGCINIRKHKAAIIEGLDQLAALSAMCFLRSFYHVLTVDPTSSVIEDMRKHHKKAFPVDTDFGGLLWYWTITKVYGLANQNLKLHHTQWDNLGLFPQQHIPITQVVAEAAQVEYSRSQHQKVPRWILHFALCSLSMHLLPPKSVIADCLSIVAIDLGCDMSCIRTTSTDRCVCI